MQFAVAAKWPLAVFACAFACLVHASNASETYTILHNFAGGSDGENPVGGLLFDSSGNLYGTTENGGSGGVQNGTVYEVTPNGNEKVLYAFQGGSDGWAPWGDLIADANGNLYGTTLYGGRMSCLRKGHDGCGTVFMVSLDGTKTLLHAFGRFDGDFPEAGLLMDAQGNLYGTTGGGGAYKCRTDAGCGTVFELAPDGTETVLHSFQGGKDGQTPAGKLITDSSGSLYGTTQYGGGRSNCAPRGCGIVFKIAPDGTESILHAFTGPDGEYPRGGLVMDQSGNLFGTTLSGGVGGAVGRGTIFEISASGQEQTLYAFKGGLDGCVLSKGLAQDSAGNFYGTTEEGGPQFCPFGGCGTVFEFSISGGKKLLHLFSGFGRGATPLSDVILDQSGNIYGTTLFTTINSCTKGCGLVFKLNASASPN